MDSLSDRLKRLGIQVGAEGLKPSGAAYPIEESVPGEVIRTSLGESYIVESRFPLGSPHGSYALQLPSSLAAVSSWAGVEDLSSLAPASIAFLDTETTGLAGGAGTLIFLSGFARVEGDELVVIQFFLRDPAEEPALLEAVDGYLNPIECLVTFNGKAFDLPLLQNRFIANGWLEAWRPASHIDLLHLARRLWRDRLPSRALGDLETQLLGVWRTEEEVPGWLVPLIYVDYLRQKDARPLKGVFYHNRMDILSMVALLDLCAGMLEGGPSSEADPIDLISMGRLWEDSGELEKAVRLYETGLASQLPPEIYLRALRRLSFIRKRERDYDAALHLWHLAAEAGEIYACIEIAKFHEHTARDFGEALRWTQSALAILDSQEVLIYQRSSWQAELQWREDRLRRKLGDT
ncbi:MAG TPA: ribonuclease H-like domain-containing protein [Anaerolineales bacterium]|nr:ribonuclease H-like domain-containing protein [Anaerolineales bacterium]